MGQQSSLSKARGDAYWWAFLLWTIFTAINLRWIFYDSQPQGCDQANHLMRSMEFASAFKSADLVRLVQLWRAEYGSVGQFTYPPLYHVATGVFMCFVRRPAVAGTLANMAFLWLLLVAVVQLGRRAFDDLAIGVTAAALTAMYFCLAQFQHEAFIDFALTAMTAWCAWRLAATEGFHRRDASILFGVSMGLGLLTKQMVVVFLYAPILYVLFRKYRSWNRGMWLNIALATGAMLLVALPWYAIHLRAVLNTFRINQEWAQVENDPMPWTVNGAIYYLHTMSSSQIGFPLFVFAIVATIVSAYHRFRFGVANDLAQRDVCGIIVCWAMGSLLVLTFIMLNKGFRYSMPLLPAVALLTCRLATSTDLPLARAVCLLAILACALPYYLFIMFGVSPLHRNVNIRIGSTYWPVWSTQNYYGGAPLHQDWNIPDMLERMRAERSSGVPIRFGIVPFLLRLNPNTVQLEAMERGIAIRVVAVGNVADLNLLRTFDFLFLKSGSSGVPWQTKQAKQINEFVARSQNFTLLRSYAMPDGSEGSLYRVVSSRPAAPKPASGFRPPD